ncbi:coproporphyrinogen III oxidase [Bacteroidia bacterium]|nr:coproporphyrinogen III oxidase [Bacteroidia bacterium]
MLGVYFHIPLCKSKCVYCDFYSLTRLPASQRAALLEAMKQEIALCTSFVDVPQPAATLYFGGGTPSLLRAGEIAALAQQALQTLGIQQVAEFTIEVNPDDITQGYLRELRSVGVNRLSIGVQSFDDNDLRWMQRRHSARQAIEGVAAAQKAGFDNISIDLIYGLPNLSPAGWKHNLDIAYSLGIQHLSAYCLSLEHNNNNIVLPSPEATAEQYSCLQTTAVEQGFEHYEISNFARQGRYARHNTLYWQQQPYVGIGAAAHSYNGTVRKSNVANAWQYINGIAQKQPSCQCETLTAAERYNELVFTGLRTQWGVNVDVVRQLLGAQWADFLLPKAAKLVAQGRLTEQGAAFVIPHRHWFVSDSIIVELICA